MRLFDLHCDTLTVCMHSGESLLHNSRHIDIARGVSRYPHWAQVMAIFVADGLSSDQAWREVCDALQYLENQQTPQSRIVFTADDLATALQNGQCAILPALENGLAIGENLSLILQLAKRGVVYITLTWNGENPFGFGCMTVSRKGLKSLGINAVVRMYQCGILPDASHLNERGFWDVAEVANGRPFLVGHTASKAVHDHPRNLTDEQFLCVKNNGGLVGLDLCADHLGTHDFSCVQRHLDHWLSLGGENVLALGMDLDGTELPKEWQGIAVASSMYGYLLNCGYSTNVLDKIFFKNSYRFFMKSLTFKEDCITIGS